MTYQSNADDRRHQTEQASMKQKINDIEVHLLETRREADEYQKLIIERNADVAELERKVLKKIDRFIVSLMCADENAVEPSQIGIGRSNSTV